jgi:hypothetical protein
MLQPGILPEVEGLVLLTSTLSSLILLKFYYKVAVLNMLLQGGQLY